MTPTKALLLIAALCALIGCENDYTPPEITGHNLPKRGYIDVAQAQEGRRLYAHRCIECHTLPSVWNYRLEDWPGIVDSMAHRSSLKPRERDAIIAYILAARGQKR